MEPVDMIELKTQNPTPGRVGSLFGLTFPTGCVEEDFAAIREQVEFRRKCMNQGFDNLLELLAMHEKSIKRHVELAAKEPANGN